MTEDSKPDEWWREWMGGCVGRIERAPNQPLLLRCCCSFGVRVLWVRKG